MPRMIELIRQSAVPANIMRTASRGALALPPAEMVEILVHLAAHPLFGEQARMTLAGWDENSAKMISGDPSTPIEVLEYLSDARNLRPNLLASLARNPSVPEARLLALASSGSVEVMAVLFDCERVSRSANLLQAIASNPGIGDRERQRAGEALAALCGVNANSEDDAEAHEASERYAREHAAEIAEEEGKGFELVTGAPDEEDELAKLLPVASIAATQQTAAPASVGAAFQVKKPDAAPERERLSVLQKIARLTVGERVQLAMKGSKDERFVLVRDGSKVVCCAVLESPKLTDTEVESFAAMKNVQEAVLRTVASKRRFMKNYAVIRALVNNPRVPFDVALPLLNHLLVSDLKNLSMNKNISETIRKLAYKQFKEKTETRKRD